ncbi:ABC transporter ATP-binding protein [Streptococcus castoreus]|uniref:ABC transporter ATP-binding protein n=1 Tax=Streptococcus castoreus TaxID=254786 RepID=UPI0004821F5A|nr:ABC transporter ATP-binding protein [Streptococcus castoreus]
MKRLYPYMKGYLKEIILGPFFKLLEALFELLVPLLIAHMIDVEISQRNGQGIFAVVLQLVLLSAISLVFSSTAQYYSSKAAVGMTRQLTDDLFEKIMFLNKEQQDHLGYASLLSRLTSDSFQVQTGINQFLRLFLRAPIIVFGAILMAYLINKQVALLFIIMVIILLVLVFFMSRLLVPLYLRIRQGTDHLVRLTSQQLQGIRVIKAFNQTRQEITQFNQQNQKLSRDQYKAATLASSLNPITFFVVNMTLLLLIWQGNLQISESLLSQGMLVALINYLLQILTELLKMTILMGTINQSLTAVKRINQVIDLANDSSSPIKEQINSSYSNLLTIEHLTFTYPRAAKPSLYDIHFRAKQGEWIGVIGGTGAGKTTLVDLICQTYPRYDGHIVLNWHGKHLKSLADWRDLIALVPQKAQLFQGTIRSNLLLGQNDPIADDQLWRALEIAQAKAFVAALPNQLESSVEAFGRNFSGGQRQRLAIARAILIPKPILILDDASSALDNLTRVQLFKAMKRNIKDSLVILVTQSVKNLQFTDNILLLDQGYQIGFARHEQLKATNSLYQEMLELQTKGKIK